MRRDVLPRLDTLRLKMPEGSNLTEPARKVRPPRDPRPATRRFTGRTRLILTTAAVAAILVNAVVAWTYWRVTAAAETRPAGDGMAIEMALPARSDLTVPLAPGARGNLLVTLINNHDFPVRITSVTLGPGRVMADDEHRDAGCIDPVVELTRERFPVRWEVQKNTVGAFTIPDALIRAPDDDMACRGAVFSIPLQASGSGQEF